MTHNVLRIIGIDPGETIGLCYLTWDVLRGDGICTAEQLPWPEGLSKVRESIPRCTHGAVEEWRLYGSKAKALIGSDMHTVELIGRIVEIAWEKGMPIERHPPQIKEPAWAYLERRGLDVPPFGNGDHARDAAAQASWTLRGLLHGRIPSEKAKHRARLSD